MNLLIKARSVAINNLSPFLEKSPEIILLGDSNTLISYFGLFSNDKWSSLISKNLGMRVGNYGKDGSTAFDFLTSKRLKRAIDKNARYYIICFGLNDEKTRNYFEFENDLLELISRIKTETKGTPILMTNLKIDYDGGRYNYDRNTEKIIPYNNIKKIVASKLDIHLIDLYARFEKEIQDGHWDHRIRNVKVFDNSFDHLHEKGSKWFSNIHLNREGNRIVADEITNYFSNILLPYTESEHTAR